MSQDEDSGGYAEESDERTAVVQLTELRVPKRMNRDRHLLVRVRGAQLGRVTHLTSMTCRVGRNPECEIWLSDDGVSRRHAQIVLSAEGYMVEDLESANGTFIGGQRIQRQLLRDSDVIQFGPNAVFRYTITDESQEALLKQLYDASVTDALTGANNREHFDTQLRAELSYARRHKTELSLLLFDVDHFKKVNDTYGHPAGDAVLIEIARAVMRGIRSEDVFARYGGEEFALILRGIDRTGAHSAGERLRESVQALKVPSDQGLLSVTVSVGAASLQDSEEKTPESMVAIADRRLYAAKRSGRNRVVAAG